MAQPQSNLYGRRLVPVRIDEIARDDPERVFYSIQRSLNFIHGFRDITSGSFAKAINRTAWFIEETIGRSSTFETIMYMGNADIRYYMVAVAAVKTGHKALFSSHRNSVAGHADLLRKTDCTILLHSTGFPIEPILEARKMRTFVFPELDELLSEEAFRPYPFLKSYDEACNDPFMVLHTSGSTGLPKPIVWPHSVMCNMDAQQLVPPLDGREGVFSDIFSSARRIFVATPIFHVSGLHFGINFPVFLGSTIVLGPAGLVTPDEFSQMLEYANIDGAICTPSTVDQVSQVPELVAKLEKLKYVAYLGGSIPHSAGAVVSKHTHLLNRIGSTETGSLICHAADCEDWEYVCFSSAYNGIEWRRLTPTSNLYQLVFIKDANLTLFQSVFKIFPHLDEYAMSDLFSKHPTKPHHWRHEGRIDDMIVFASGWNFNPVAHEKLIAEHTAVKACVLVGTGRYKPAALIELHSGQAVADEQAKKAAIESIWPKVEEANRLADSTGQLDARHVLFASPEKPFAVAAKGTLQRKATVELYREEIERLYERAGE